MLHENLRAIGFSFRLVNNQSLIRSGIASVCHLGAVAESSRRRTLKTLREPVRLLHCPKRAVLVSAGLLRQLSVPERADIPASEVASERDLLCADAGVQEN
jgi:hypothetical protein